MQIQFSVTPDEYQEYLKYGSTRIVKLSKSAWLVSTLNFTMWFIIVFALVGLVRFLTTQTNIDPSIILYSALIFAVLGLAFLASIILKYKALFNNYCAEGGLLTSQTTISLSNECLRVHMPHFRAQYYWPILQDVTQTKNLILVFYDNSLAQVIPKRAFSSPEQLQEFLSFINDKKSSQDSINISTK